MSKTERAEELYREGTRLLEADPQGAVTQLTDSLRIDPENPMARYNRAVAYGRLGKYAQAVADINYLEDRHPEMGGKLRHAFMMGAVPLVDIAKRDYESRDFAAALQKCNDALVLDPTCSEARALKGRTLIEIGRFKEGMAFLDEAVQQEQDCYFAFMVRAQVYMNQRRYQEALADYSRAIALSPDSAEAYLGRSEAYVALRKMQEANEDLSKARSLE